MDRQARKPVTKKQALWLLDYMEKNPLMGSGLCIKAYKRRNMEQWARISESLNKIEDGAVKSAQNWLKYWRSWKIGVRNKNNLPKQTSSTMSDLDKKLKHLLKLWSRIDMKEIICKEMKAIKSSNSIDASEISGEDSVITKLGSSIDETFAVLSDQIFSDELKQLKVEWLEINKLHLKNQRARLENENWKLHREMEERRELARLQEERDELNKEDSDKRETFIKQMLDLFSRMEGNHRQSK